MRHFWAQNISFAPNKNLTAKNDGLKDRWKVGRTGGPYFIGPFQPRPRVQKTRRHAQLPEKYLFLNTEMQKTFSTFWRHSYISQKTVKAPSFHIY